MRHLPTLAAVAIAAVLNPAARAQQDAPATRAPQDAPAVRAPQDAPATRAPQNAPATRAPQNAPAVRAPQEAAARPFNDALFTTAAAASGMAEVAISELALQRSQNEQIREFAQMLVKDHTQANNELKQLAAAKRIAIPAQLQFTEQAAADILAGLSGSKFDREYAKNQVAGHICAVALLQAEAERGRDPQLRAFAEKYLPIVEGHLKRAGELAGIAIPAGSTQEIQPAAPETP